MIEHTFARSVPDWARELLTDVLLEYRYPFPVRVTWRTAERMDSSGLTSESQWRGAPTVVHVSAGTWAYDQRHVLLHETAHVIAGCEHAHDYDYYRTLYPMLFAHGITPGYAIWRESSGCGGTRNALDVAEDMGYSRIAARLRARIKSGAPIALPMDHRLELEGLQHV